MRRFVAGISLMAITACGSGVGTAPVSTPDTTTAETVPEITPDAAAELLARAFVIGCEDIACESRPIYASDIIPEAVRAPIANLLSVDVSYLSDEQAAQIEGTTGGYPGGGSWIGVDEVEGTERPDVVSVMTYVYGSGRNMGTQTLFLWDGEEWVHVTAEEVGVTVVTAVP